MLKNLLFRIFIPIITLVILYLTSDYFINSDILSNLRFWVFIIVCLWLFNLLTHTIWRRIQKKWLKISFVSTWVAMGNALVLFFALSTAITFESPSLTSCSSPGKKLNRVNDTTLFIECWGNKGTRTAAGWGVFQEKRITSNIGRRKLLCFTQGSQNKIDYEILDQQTIRCKKSDKVETIKLPL